MPLTNDEKREYLGRYRLNELEIVRLQEELIEWESRACRVTESWKLTAGSGPGEGFQLCVDYIVEYQRELRDRLQESLRMRREIARAIMSLPDARLRQLMSYRYIDGLTITATAEKMSYSTRQVNNLLVAALRGICFEAPPPTAPAPSAENASLRESAAAN